MRPLAVILVWVVILGGLAVYMNTRDYLNPRTEHVYEIQPAPGEFILEVTPTFDVQGGVDDFSLDATSQPAFVVSLGGEDIITHEQSARAGIPIALKWDTDRTPLEVGKNEFHIEMTTPADEIDVAHGVRLRLLRDGAEVAASTLWAEPGLPVKGILPIQLDDSPATEHDDSHNHEVE